MAPAGLSFPWEVPRPQTLPAHDAVLSDVGSWGELRWNFGPQINSPRMGQWHRALGSFLLPLVNVKCFFGFGASLKPLEKQVESSALVLLHGVIDMMLPITLIVVIPLITASFCGTHLPRHGKHC